MPSNILVTGANRGLGLEFCRQYAHAGWRVFACCRNPQSATELQKLQQQYANNLSVHTLDVSDFRQIEPLAKELSGIKLDILLNNAGIYHKGKEAFGSVDYEAWMEAFHVNSMAPLKMAEVFIQNLHLGDQKKIVNITSKMGSIDDNTSGHHYLYRSSKTALNMVTRSLAIDLAPQGIMAIVLHPGWVQTDMGGFSAPTTVQQSIAGMRNVIEHISSKDSGKFYGYDGKEIPW
ncbi:MAG TPA: SDR family oxidoreductase [Methylophilaceae bacterium]|jgi:NAD(P)-dependent dehydrogenase (short-subunit alcohol dehydrogenase family)